MLPFPGTVAARLLCLLLALGVTIIECYRNPQLMRGFPPARWAIALWALLATASLAYSVAPEYSMKELQNEVVYTMAAFFCFFIAAQKRESAQTLLRSLAIGLFLIGGIAIHAWFKNHMAWQETGIHGGVGSFSTYLVSAIPALFWLSREDDSARWRGLALAGIVFAVLLAFLTLQRAVWPALAAECAIALVLLHSSGHWRMTRKVRVGLIAALLVAGIVALSVSNKMRGVEGISGLIPSTESFNAPIAKQDGADGDPRLPFWPAIFKTIAEHPVAGTGFGQGLMKKDYPELVPPNFTALWHAHNTVLNYALQLGIPGALALIYMLFELARFYWQALKRDPAIATAAIAGIMLLAGVFLRNQTNDFFRRDMALLFWCLMGIFSALSMSRKA